MDDPVTSQFWDRGYEVVEDLIDPSQIAMASAAMDVSLGQGKMRTRDDGHVYVAEDEHGPLVGELLLRHCRDAIEAVVGRDLIESYAYWRIYNSGAELLKHKDRAAGEVAVSMTIKANPAEDVWPIKLEDLQGKPVSIVLKPGSGIVYQGHKIPHWRDKLEAGSQKQLMLFYLQKDGDFTDYAFDGRDGDPIVRTPV